MEIRNYRKEDIEKLVDFTTYMFKLTYKGIINNEYIENFSKRRDERIEFELEDFDRRSKNVFVLIDNEKLIGYIEVDRCKHEEYKDHGEVEMIYLDPFYQGKGLGKELFYVGVNRLKEMGYKDFYVGCLRGNESQKFYHHLGGVYVFSKPLTFGDMYIEDYFYFKDVNMF